jgi:hypothetical protein
MKASGFRVPTLLPVGSRTRPGGRKGHVKGRLRIAALATFLLLPLGGVWARDAGESPVRNYGVVWPGKLTRSGLPDSDSEWRWLRHQGVKSIVTFLGHDDDDVDYEKYGFEHVLRIPLDDEDVPTEAQSRSFLAFVQDPNHWPVHMHCHAGKDRTGMMAALVRYAVDGWSLDRALAEARPYRKGKDLAEFRVEWLEKWAALHAPGSERRPAE